MTELLDDLLKRCQKCEQTAYKVLVRRFQNKALGLAEVLVGDRHLAEDAVQAAFLTAFCRLDQLREPAAFPGWFRQIVRTESMRITRKYRKQPLEHTADEKKNQFSPVENLELKELQQLVRKALDELPMVSRETVELFYLDEQNHIEVAEALNVPRGTVKRRLYDARQKLREMLLGYVEEPAAKRKTARKYDKRIPL